MNTLTISGLTKVFKSKTVLNNVALELCTGTITGVFGSNGSGKSTLLKIIFGTVKADSIHIKLNGNSINTNEVIPRQIVAYLPQEPFIPKNLKVRDVIPLYYKGDLQDKIFYAPGISKITATTVGRLSMGELRYLELLLVGNLNHPFIMLDEPFSMVEPLYKEKIKEFLVALKETKGILLTDHYYKDVLSISTNNLLLKQAQMITIATEKELADEGYLPSAKII